MKGIVDYIKGFRDFVVLKNEKGFLTAQNCQFHIKK